METTAKNYFESRQLKTGDIVKFIDSPEMNDKDNRNNRGEKSKMWLQFDNGFVRAKDISSIEICSYTVGAKDYWQIYVRPKCNVCFIVDHTFQTQKEATQVAEAILEAIGVVLTDKIEVNNFKFNEEE